MLRTGLVLAAAMLAAPLTAAAPAKWAGVWRNGSNSVHIRTAPCGPGMCGTVVWASDKAKADVAARGGTLIGAQLFRDFVRGDDGLWHGEVYIPDIGQSITGTITQNDANTITGTGCVIAGFGCKTQVWTRVK